MPTTTNKKHALARRSRPTNRSLSRPKKRQQNDLTVFADSSAPFGGGTLAFPKFFGGGAVPPRKMVTFPYSFQDTLTAGAAGVFGTEAIFRLNSIYDPYYSGVGQYPNGYTAWSNFYAGYRVHRVKIDLTFTDPSADGMVVGALVQYSNATTSLGSNTIQTADEMQKSDVRPLNNTGSQTVRLTRTFNLWDLDGNSRLQWLANGGYQAVFGQNPTLTPWIRIACAAFATGSPTVVCMVRLTFYAELFDRLDLTS
jgi:hypothetical protein